jgi:hypothetical protein
MNNIIIIIILHLKINILIFYFNSFIYLPIPYSLRPTLDLSLARLDSQINDLIFDVNKGVIKGSYLLIFLCSISFVELVRLAELLTLFYELHFYGTAARFDPEPFYLFDCLFLVGGIIVGTRDYWFVEIFFFLT